MFLYVLIYFPIFSISYCDTSIWFPLLLVDELTVAPSRLGPGLTHSSVDFPAVVPLTFASRNHKSNGAGIANPKPGI